MLILDQGKCFSVEIKKKLEIDEEGELLEKRKMERKLIYFLIIFFRRTKLRSEKSETHF